MNARCLVPLCGFLLAGCVPDAHPIEAPAAEPDAGFALPACRHATVGFSDPSTVVTRDDTHLARSLDFNSVRVRTSWAECEPYQGAFDWSKLATQLDAATAAGLRVTLELGPDTPAWACTSAPDSGACPVVDDDFRAFAAALATAFPGAFAAVTFCPMDLDNAPFGRDPQWTNLHYETFKEAFSSGGGTRSVVMALGLDYLLVRVLAVCDGAVSAVDLDGSPHDGVGGVSTIGPNTLTIACNAFADRVAEAHAILWGAPYDVLDLRVLGDVPNWAAYAGALRADAGGKDIGFAVFGGPDTTREPTSDAYQIARMADYLTSLDKLDVSTLEFESLRPWDDAPEAWAGSYLVGTRGEARPAAHLLRAYSALPICAPW